MSERQQTQQEFWEELERLGLTEVRTRLETDHWGGVSLKGPWAREWLLRQEGRVKAEAEEARAASMLEQIRIARSAKNAAWAAAIAAIIAAISAIVAIVITFLK
jgi:hypothetical protein